MSTDEIARLSVAQQRIVNELERVQSLITFAAPLESTEARLRYVIGEAQGDLDGALARGHKDTGNEHALLGAIHLWALLEQQANLARCSCPLQDGVPEEARFVNPFCVVHGDGDGS